MVLVMYLLTWIGKHFFSSLLTYLCFKLYSCKEMLNSVYHTLLLSSAISFNYYFLEVFYKSKVKSLNAGLHV